MAARRHLLILGVLLVSACSRPAAPQPNVLLIVLDTVRGDRMSYASYGRPTTPFLARLAGESRIYLEAFSTACWTVPSHASLFTGMYPAGHRVHWEHIEMDDEAITMAEILRDHGYRTMGFVENSLIARNGMNQGFATFEQVWGKRTAASVSVMDRLRAALEQPSEQPFFIFINLIGAHSPYDSSGPYFKTFLSDPAYADYYDVEPLKHIKRGERLSPAQRLHLGEHYDAEILLLDHRVAQMVDELRGRRLLDSTVLIVTSDHGEGFDEHGFVRHQFNLYDTLLRIPLMVRYPERFPPGSVERNPVQITDVFPTVLELAGIDPRGFPSQGRSLLPDATVPNRPIIAESYRHAGFTSKRLRGRRQFKHPAVKKVDRRLSSVRSGAMKLILGSDGSAELFDLGADPDEQHNLAEVDAYARQRQRLTRLLEEHLREYRGSGETAGYEVGTPDPVTEEQLRALGYLGE